MSSVRSAISLSSSRLALFDVVELRGLELVSLRHRAVLLDGLHVDVSELCYLLSQLLEVVFRRQQVTSGFACSIAIDTVMS